MKILIGYFFGYLLGDPPDRLRDRDFATLRASKSRSSSRRLQFLEQDLSYRCKPMWGIRVVEYRTARVRTKGSGEAVMTDAPRV